MLKLDVRKLSAVIPKEKLEKFLKSLDVKEHESESENKDKK